MVRKPKTTRKLTSANVKRHYQRQGVYWKRKGSKGSSYSTVMSPARTWTTVSRRSNYKGNREDEKDTGTIDLTREHVVFGKSQKSLKDSKPKSTFDKLVKASEQTQILRAGAVSAYLSTTSTPMNQKATTVGGGAYHLYNYYSSGTYLYMPCHVWDITSINNIVNGSIVQDTPGKELRFTISGGVPINADWATLDGRASDTTSTGGCWQADSLSASASGPVIQPNRRCMQDWTQAKILCYGAAKQPTEFVIEFIQIKEDYLHPPYTQAEPVPGTYESLVSGALSFWQNYSKPFSANPISETSALKRKDIKVLKSIRFTLQSRESSDSYANVGHMKHLNIFFRMKRMCKYDWLEWSTDLYQNNPTSFAANTGHLSTRVHPKARIYMTIRATNTTQVTSPANASTDYMPSYDLVLKKKYTTLQ